MKTLGIKKRLTPSQIVINYARAAEQNDETDSSASQDLSPSSSPCADSTAIQPEDKKTRWKWNNEKVSSLISCLYEYKTKRDFEGKDMEADLVKFYEDIRRMMASMYPPEDFGPEKLSDIPQAIDNNEKAKLERFVNEERKQIATGYGRIKCRVKLVRQNFKKAIIEGTRSGSGKLIVENWDKLVLIWGSCPSVNKIDGAVTSQDIADDGGSEDAEENTSIESQEEAVGQGLPTDSDEKAPSTEPVEEPPRKKMKLTDNKRAKLEKSISVQQRDQIMLQVAKEELELKKKNADTLENTGKGMEKMVEMMSQSLNSLGQQLGNGLMLLSQAIMTGNQHQPPQQQYLPQYSTPYYQQRPSHQYNNNSAQNNENEYNIQDLN